MANATECYCEASKDTDEVVLLNCSPHEHGNNKISVLIDFD